MTKRKRISKAVRLLVLSLSIYLLCGAAVFGGQAPIEVQIPVEQIFQQSGIDKVEDSFVYEIYGDRSTDPLPETASGGSFKFILKGSEKTNLKINYSRAGLYKYKIKQVISKKISGYSYDEQIYDVDVYIKNLNDYAFTSQVIIKNQMNNKPVIVKFSNKYSGRMKVEKIKTGDSSLIAFYLATGVVALLLLVILSQRKFNND